TGRAGLVYVTSAYASGTGTDARYASRGGPAAAWTAPVTVSETLPNTVGYITSPAVGVDTRGLATVAWLGRGIEAVRQVGSDSWTSPATVIPSPNVTVSFGSPDIGVDRSGSAILAVSIFDATINVDRASAWAARGASSGSWTAPVRLTDPAVPIDAYAVRAAIAPEGGLVLVAWADHFHGTVQVARLDLTTGTWTTTNVGKGTAWSSFQEVVSLEAASSTTARIAWKNAKTGTQVFVADFRG
ncbi:MAG TPA: hypothetical protein VF484_05370, partial [Candidatus Limnocylindrales bacterium]